MLTPTRTPGWCLQLYILSEKLKKKAKWAGGDEPEASDVTVQATGAVSWRKEGIRHKKNEVRVAPLPPPFLPPLMRDAARGRSTLT